MKYLKTFEDNSSVRSEDLNDILLELGDIGLKISIDTPAMRQDWIRVIVESDGENFLLQDVQDTLCRLYDYTNDKVLPGGQIRRPSITAFGFRTGSMTLNYHDLIREYRNGNIRKDTYLKMLVITIAK